MPPTAPLDIFKDLSAWRSDRIFITFSDSSYEFTHHINKESIRYYFVQSNYEANIRYTSYNKYHKGAYTRINGCRITDIIGRAFVEANATVHASATLQIGSAL